MKGVLEANIKMVQPCCVELANGTEHPSSEVCPGLPFDLHLIENSTILSEFKH